MKDEVEYGLFSEWAGLIGSVGLIMIETGFELLNKN